MLKSGALRWEERPVWYVVEYGVDWPVVSTLDQNVSGSSLIWAAVHCGLKPVTY